MGNPGISRADAEEVVRVYSECIAAGFKEKGSPSATAETGRRLNNMPRGTVASRLEAAKKQFGLAPGSAPQAKSSPPIFPDFPDEDVSVEEIIDLQCRRFAKRKASHDAHTWFPVQLQDNRPVGIMFMGDPHVDDNGCDWPSLRRHAELCRTTEGLYAVNIGDTTNCWGGRLIRKYADQDTSAKTARRLAEWLLIGSGIKWLVFLFGNHEHMGDGMHVLAEMAKRYGTHKVVMHDWEARFVLTFPDGTGFRINCAHDFAGNSMWNPLHGQVKASRFGQDADVFVAGHKHNWGLSHWELAEKGISPLLIRARGYKFMDDYARKIGKYDQEDGQSVLVIFDPTAKTASGRTMAFVDVERGVEYLTWLRTKV